MLVTLLNYNISFVPQHDQGVTVGLWARGLLRWQAGRGDWTLLWSELLRWRGTIKLSFFCPNVKESVPTVPLPFGRVLVLHFNC